MLRDCLSFSFDGDDYYYDDKDDNDELFSLHFSTTIISSWGTDYDKVMERYSVCVCVKVSHLGSFA